MRFTRTLAGRLFTLTAIWAVFSIALIAWLISQNYRENVEANLVDRLNANLYNIMGSVSPGPDGRLIGRPDLRDSRFQQFQSGYYWSVSEVGNAANQISSSSLVGERIEIPPTTVFDDSFQRQTRSVDRSNNDLIAIEAQAFLGEGDNLFSFKITGNQSEVEEQVGSFVQELILLLSAFALGFILVTFFIVKLGLKPLREATRKLGDVRDGKIENLDGEYPLEVQPLIDETNALIQSNKVVVDRARTQVGNLAHSLKTPLAVLKNEGAKTRPELRGIIEQQIEQMQSQVQTYLNRARISARAGTITSRTDVKSALERLVRVMRKLNPQLGFEVKVPQGDGIVFAGEQQDFEEMVGNLLENASKFADQRVLLHAERSGERNIVISIQDDGPGMNPDQAKAALARGTRIDESKPGSGLGLSIVKDIASEYSGTITFDRSPMGGLSALLTLPSTKA